MNTIDLPAAQSLKSQYEGHAQGVVGMTVNAPQSARVFVVFENKLVKTHKRECSRRDFNYKMGN